MIVDELLEIIEKEIIGEDTDPTDTTQETANGLRQKQRARLAELQQENEYYKQMRDYLLQRFREKFLKENA